MSALDTLPEDAPAAQTWPKRCACGTAHDVASWSALKLLGHCGEWQSHGVRYAVELRDCVCGSTIGIETTLPERKEAA